MFVNLSPIYSHINSFIVMFEISYDRITLGRFVIINVPLERSLDSVDLQLMWKKLVKKKNIYNDKNENNGCSLRNSHKVCYIHT